MITVGRSVALVLLLALPVPATCEWIAPGYQPRQQDEIALWYAFERGEKLLAGSPLRIRDESLQRLVEAITCRLAPAHCNDFRVYLSWNPEFNATMSGNGALHLHSGALLRLHNEAQLAALIGHEIAHYLQRDALRQWRSAKQAGAIAEVLSFGISPVGDLLSGGFFAGLLPFSQSQELTADRIGMQLMRRAGYDPREAPKVWAQFAAEQEAAGLGATGALVLSTHPGSANRGRRLQRKLRELRTPLSGEVGNGSYRNAVQPWLARLLREQIKSHQPKRTLHLLQHLPHSWISAGERDYYRAEVSRILGSRRDLLQAEQLYRRAITGGAPVVAYRDLGFTALRLQRPAAAQRALTQYLRRANRAEDRALVAAILARIKQ